MYPILFELGPVRLYSYGLMLALGFLLAVNLAERRARGAGLDSNKIQTLALVALLAGLIGARLGYVFLNWRFFAQRPLEIFRLDHGGLVFYGGLAVGVLVGIWVARRQALPGWKTLDVMAPPFVLAHAVGRIGCFLNGCCYGKPSSVPWAVVFPNDLVSRHPVQLYEAAALVGIFFLLTRAERSNPRPGTVTLIYGFFYGGWRFFIEYFRGDNPVVALGLTVFQWLSIGLIALVWILSARQDLSRPGGR